MAEFDRLRQLTFADKFEPVGDVVVDGAFPFAIGVAARQASLGLCRYGLVIKLTVNLVVVTDANLRGCGRRIVAREIKKLKKRCH